MPRPTASTSGEYTSQLATRWLSTQQPALKSSTRYSVQTCHSWLCHWLSACGCSWSLARRFQGRESSGWRLDLYSWWHKSRRALCLLLDHEHRHQGLSIFYLGVEVIIPNLQCFATHFPMQSRAAWPSSPQLCDVICCQGWLPQWTVDQALGGTLLEFLKHLRTRVKTKQLQQDNGPLYHV